jgi:hypothetical protein
MIKYFILLTVTNYISLNNTNSWNSNIINSSKNINDWIKNDSFSDFKMRDFQSFYSKLPEKCKQLKNINDQQQCNNVYEWFKCIENKNTFSSCFGVNGLNNNLPKSLIRTTTVGNGLKLGTTDTIPIVMLSILVSIALIAFIICIYKIIRMKCC